MGKESRSRLTQTNIARDNNSQVARTKRKGLAFTVAVGLLSTTFIALPFKASAANDYGNSSSASNSVNDPVIDVDTANANLLSVIQTLKAESHAQIVVISSAKYRPVTLSVTATLGDALRYVAQSAGAELSQDENGVYILRPQTDSDGSVQATAFEPQNAPPVQQESYHSERLALVNISPNFVLNMLDMPDGYRDNDPAHDPALMGPTGHPYLGPQITQGPSAVKLDTGNQNVIPASAPGYQGMPNGSVQANDSATGPANAAGQAPFGGVINPFAPGGGGGTPGFGAPNQFGGGNGAAGGQGANLRPQGIVSIVANEQDNSLIVKGTTEGITELKQLISFLDRAPKQVQIKVQYITTTVNDADQFGISWDLIPFPNVDVNFDGNGAGASAPGTTLLSYAQGNLVARMQFLLQTTKGKLVNSVTLTTTNNTAANANFSTVIPFTTSSTSQNSGSSVTSTSTSFITVPNVLSITPRINGDNSVSLFVTPTISTATQSAPGLAPTVSTQSISTYRTVANGETMVLGGLVVKQESNGANKVPFLSDLPIIGPLFRTRDSTVSGSELLIFVTPEVLPPIGADFGGVSPSGAPAGGATDTTAAVGVGVGVTP